jgi:hypothetical protein
VVDPEVPPVGPQHLNHLVRGQGLLAVNRREQRQAGLRARVPDGPAQPGRVATITLLDTVGLEKIGARFWWWFYLNGLASPAPASCAKGWPTGSAARSWTAPS